MPELPEIEAIARELQKDLEGAVLSRLSVFEETLLRNPSEVLSRRLTGARVCRTKRLGKYLGIEFASGDAIWFHFGMTGQLLWQPSSRERDPHCHLALIFDGGARTLFFRDPRRFGCILWTEAEPEQHKLLSGLGPEPLNDELSGDYLFRRSRKRTQSIKSYIMDSHTVAGVGNIYANESLFMAGINPARKAGKITRERYDKLAQSIKTVLKLALARGGTTLRDFVNGAGEPGYFRHELQVYDRAGEPCRKCKSLIKMKRLGQRSAFYCLKCQQ